MRKRVFGRGSVLLAGAVAASVMVRCAASGDGSLASQEAGAQQTDDTPETQLQESDIYKRDGNRLFVLNRYKGLLVTNLANLDAPRMEGRLALPAQGREMWVTGNTALIITAQPTAWGTAWWWNGQDNVDVSTLRSYTGSALVLADVSQPQEPRLLALQRLAGDCFDGRLRGTTLYLACESDVTGGTGSHVYALDVSVPSSPRVISDVVFPTYGTQHITVSDTTIYLADPPANVVNATLIHLLDITAADGSIQRRGTAQVTGTVVDRFAMDAFQGVLRVATGDQGAMVMTTFDVSNPDAPRQLGSTRKNVQERVMSARFDGDRGYVVTFRNVDPLFVFDLSDATNPRVTAELQMTGWLDFIVPMGHRLLAMGHDDVEMKPRSPWQLWPMRRRTLAVSLIDVENDPRLLSRVPLDGAWGTIPAERDDYNKLFRVFPEQGLVVFPYRTFSTYGYAQKAGMLLLDLQGDSLTLRKDLQDLGLVERGILWDSTTLVTLSLQCLQVFNIADHGSPQLRATLELARQVSEFVVLPDNTVVELGGDFGVGSATLSAHGLDAPVHLDNLSTITMDAPTGHIFANGTLVYFVGMHKPFAPYVYRYGAGSDGEEEPAQPTTVTIVDYADPANPVVKSTLTLKDEVLFGDSFYRYGAGTQQAVQARPGVLVLLQPPHYRYQGCRDTSDPARLHVVDLTNPLQPRLGNMLELDRYGASGLQMGGGHAFLASYQGLQVLDASNPEDVSLHHLTDDSLVAISSDSDDVVTMRQEQNGNSTLVSSKVDGLALHETTHRVLGPWYAANGVAGAGLVAMSGYGAQVLSLSDLHTVTQFTSSEVAQVLSLQPGSLVSRDAAMLHFHTVDAQGVTLQASFPVAGRSQAAMVRDGVIYAATGYYGFIRYAPVAQ